MSTQRLTTAQALVEFLANQYVERDGSRSRFFAGMFGIFGHGNVAGIGQALQQAGKRFPYYLVRNEQAMVHAAAGFAKMSNRLATLACTSSIGPGATNMVTGAAGATINRLPVLLVPGDIFASRRFAPVLQQLEAPWSQDVSVNDALKPVSRYWDRIQRPEQLVTAAMEAMRVLTSPADTGAVTLALPQDVQTEAWDFPDVFLRERVWTVARPLPDARLIDEAVTLIRSSKRPLIVAGGGVVYSDAAPALRAFVDATGIPVAETQAGKGSLSYDHPSCLGAIGVTGTPGANIVAREADLVIGLGTRYSDFTTSSKTAFQHPEVRFINVNVAQIDAYKHAGIALVGDARVTLEALLERLKGFSADPAYAERVASLNRDWNDDVGLLFHPGNGSSPSQAEVIGVVNEMAGERGVVVCAAGSLPGDLHKLWRATDPKGYHMEYGYSCMGYEVPGGMGVKMAAPERDVFVMVGDGSWLMMCSEIVTCVQENVKLIVVLIDNQGFASIGGLSESIGSGGFGTRYRYRGVDGELSGDPLPVDLVANAASLGAHAVRAGTIEDLRRCLDEAKGVDRTCVVVIETDPSVRVGGYESWWAVPVAEVSTMTPVKDARELYERDSRDSRWYL